MGQIKFKRYINFAIAFSVISSIAVIMAMFNNCVKENPVINIMGSLVFWLGLVLEQFFIWKANAIRKQISTEHTHGNSNFDIGLISFMKTEVGFCCDVCLTISFLVYLILSIGGWGNTIQYTFLFLIVLSFRLHCIANGKNYRYKKYLAKRKVD